MKKVVIDSSVFLSSFLPNEENSKASKEFFEVIQSEKITIFLSMLTLFEVLHSYYRVTKNSQATEQVHQFFIDLNISKGLKIMSLEAAALAHFVTRHEDLDIKTSDTVIALTALREKCPLISWDKQMLKAAAKEVEAYTPTGFLKHFDGTPILHSR